MLQVEVSTPSPEPSRPSLADLSRNASVISSSSSSGSTSSLLLQAQRPRPVRTFTSPRSRSRDVPGPAQPAAPSPPAYLAKELGLAGARAAGQRGTSRSASRTASRSSSVGRRMQAGDFEFGEVLGEGSYSTVMHAVYPPTGQAYAIKVLDKGHLKRNNKLQTALTEKNTLVRLGSGHPGVVRLHWAFHDEWSLFFVLDLAKNGELQSRISRLGSLSIECSRYYAAQIVDALAYIHSKDVIHRDLKPENVLLDDAMRVKITDFGTGKILEPGVDRAGTFVGTAQYVSPELLSSNTTYKSSDLWALGCIIYQMIAGRFPFHGLSEYLTWQKIKNLEYTFPEGFDEDAKDLVQKLLVLDHTQRLGAGAPGTPNDAGALRAHPFFANVNWTTLWTEPAPPLDAGLVRRAHPLAGTATPDAGAAWDAFVGGLGVSDELSDGLSDDEAEYGDGVHEPRASGEYRLAFARVHDYAFPVRVNGNAGGGREIGPLDAAPPHDALGNGDLDRDTYVVAWTDAGGVPRAPGMEARNSVSTVSSSSSEGSPVERLNGAMDGLSVTPRRGRDRVQTPTQLSDTAPDGEWADVLQPDETVLFHSAIEVHSRARRLTVTLLPLPVTTGTRKRRHLVLTNHRLVCVKMKRGQSVVVKSEVLVLSTGKSRVNGDKRDARAVVMDVAPKGAKEFVVVTSAKTVIYTAADPALAALWVKEIRAALDPASGVDAQPNGRRKSDSPSRERVPAS